MNLSWVPLVLALVYWCFMWSLRLFVMSWSLVSIFVGMSLLGFWGLFVGPLAVTILKRLHEQDKLNMVNFFRGDVDGVHSDIEIIEEIDRFDEIEDVIDEKVD